MLTSRRASRQPGPRAGGLRRCDDRDGGSTVPHRSSSGGRDRPDEDDDQDEEYPRHRYPDVLGGRPPARRNEPDEHGEHRVGVPRLPTNMVVPMIRRRTRWLTTFSASVVVKPAPLIADLAWNAALSGGTPVAIEAPGATFVKATEMTATRMRDSIESRPLGFASCSTPPVLPPPPSCSRLDIPATPGSPPTRQLRRGSLADRRPSSHAARLVRPHRDLDAVAGPELGHQTRQM